MCCGLLLTLGHHQPNAAAATSDECDLVLDIEEVLQLELVVVGLSRHVGALSGECGNVIVELSDSVDRMTCCSSHATTRGTYSSSLIAPSIAR